MRTSPAERRNRHAESLRRQRTRALRALPRHRVGGEPERPRGDAGPAARDLKNSWTPRHRWPERIRSGSDIPGTSSTRRRTARGFGHGERIRRPDEGGVLCPYTRRWLANILGANAMGTSLIVGDGTTSPTACNTRCRILSAHQRAAADSGRCGGRGPEFVRGLAGWWTAW